MKNIKNDKKYYEFIDFSKNKIIYLKELINKTIDAYDFFQKIDIITSGQINSCIKKINNIYESCKKIEKILNEEEKINKDDILKNIQNIINDFFLLIKSYGTKNIDDILKISFGKDFINSINSNEKYKVLLNHLTPYSFKVLHKYEKNIVCNQINESNNKKTDDNYIIYNTNTFDCFDLSRSEKNFNIRVNGIKTVFHDTKGNKTVIIYGILDNVLLYYYDNTYIKNIINNLYDIYNTNSQFSLDSFKNYIDSLTLKDLLINSIDEHCSKYIGGINQITLMKQKPISQIVKEFINDDLFLQRKTLINLLIHNNDPTTQYLAYLLYDLLGNDDKGNIDTKEQRIIYNSLPWNIKQKFKDAMMLTIDYTKQISSFDNNKIPLEQQICLMRVKNNVKEKAMNKLKEIKSKSEDSGSKARQYLEGLLNIPFGIYKKEHCLNIQKELIDKLIHFINDNNMLNEINNICDICDISNNKLTTFSCKKIISYIENKHIINNYNNTIVLLKNKLINQNKKTLIENIALLNNFIKIHNINYKLLIYSGKNMKFIKSEITKFIDFIHEENNSKNIYTLIHFFKDKLDKNIYFIDQFNDIKNINNDIKNNMLNIRKILDKSVFGHNKAKRQIERIIGQWMSGESKGYCFGFEGAPGIGKTSLAKKGLAKCLVDKDGSSRPFGFIAIGGSSNGSVLEGHNYTYVGSTWGRIVDILIESKCMNPIIFIDELDKISKTEHGKEIIGILTHLVDPTQNDAFQDKYFNGIDIDLSKALFIFSYNDVSLLDRILLDRIHRIKFDNLSVKDKITITKQYILPEIYNAININEAVIFTDEIIEYIIENYTCECGVRKLKEIFFEIISEINLQILREEDNEIEYPIHITEELLANVYLKNYKKLKPKRVHKKNEIGIINGLWANSLGQGGIIPIQTSFFPTSTFLDLKLTGMQGDVMKESMNVAKSLAYKLTPSKRQKELIKIFKDTQLQGIHIHCPEGAVPKDGPSAGTAITTCIYSLLNKKKIKNNIAITGEINLQGFVTAIGGIDLKIIGGIKAGVKEFIYPHENDDDFNDFMKKYSENPIIEGIKFHSVNHINEVLDIVFS